MKKINILLIIKFEIIILFFSNYFIKWLILERKLESFVNMIKKKICIISEDFVLILWIICEVMLGLLVLL